MTAQNALKIGILAGLLVATNGTACGAKPLARKAPVAPATELRTPELDRADERVKQAKVQLETAKKQLNAARALLRAAEADLKASEADREALALRTTAHGLAHESGLPIAQAPNHKRETAEAQPPAAPAASATPAPAPQDGSDQSTRIQPLDFNADPAASAPLPLR